MLRACVVRSSDDILQYDTMVVSAGGRFKVRCRFAAPRITTLCDAFVHYAVQSFGSAVARTYLVNPSALQKKAYQALLDVQQYVLDGLKPGEKVVCIMYSGAAIISQLFWGCVSQISTVVRRAKDKIDAKAASGSFVEGFVAGLLPTFGAGIGLVPKEVSLELREGNDTVLR
jgi:hypothetical protein